MLLENENHHLFFRQEKSNSHGVGVALISTRLIIATLFISLCSSCLPSTDGKSNESQIQEILPAYDLSENEGVGGDIPLQGRSSFDLFLADYMFKNGFSDPSRALREHLYPFEKLMNEINKTTATRYSGEAEFAKNPAVLFPRGRSLARFPLSDWYAPRIVFAVTNEAKNQMDDWKNIPPTESVDIAINYANRLYIGMVDIANELEIISFNPTLGRFEYQVVTDYAPKKQSNGVVPEAKLLYAQRNVCVQCHQNQALIFSAAGWNETNIHPFIRDIMIKRTEERIAQPGVSPAEKKFLQKFIDSRIYNGVPLEVPEDVARNIDRSTEVGSQYIAARKLWIDGCGKTDNVPENSEIYAPEACRGKVLLYALASALVYGKDLTKVNGDTAWKKLNRTLASSWAKYVDSKTSPGVGFRFVSHHITNRSPCLAGVCAKNGEGTLTNQPEVMGVINDETTETGPELEVSRNSERLKRVLKRGQNSGIAIRDEPMAKRIAFDHSEYPNTPRTRQKIIWMLESMHFTARDRRLIRSVLEEADFKSGGIVEKAIEMMVKRSKSKSGEDQYFTALSAVGFQRQAVFPAFFEALRKTKSNIESPRKIPNIVGSCVAINESDGSSCLDKIPLSRLADRLTGNFPEKMQPFLTNCGLCHAGQTGPMGFLTGNTLNEKIGNFVARSHRIHLRLSDQAPEAQRMPRRIGGGKVLYQKLWHSPDGKLTRKRMHDFALCVANKKTSPDDVAALEYCNI